MGFRTRGWCQRREHGTEDIEHGALGLGQETLNTGLWAWEHGALDMGQDMGGAARVWGLEHGP